MWSAFLWGEEETKRKADFLVSCQGRSGRGGSRSGGPCCAWRPLVPLLAPTRTLPCLLAAGGCCWCAVLRIAPRQDLPAFSEKNTANYYKTPWRSLTTWLQSAPSTPEEAARCSRPRTHEPERCSRVACSTTLWWVVVPFLKQKKSGKRLFFVPHLVTSHQLSSRKVGVGAILCPRSNALRASGGGGRSGTGIERDRKADRGGRGGYRREKDRVGSHVRISEPASPPCLSWLVKVRRVYSPASGWLNRGHCRELSWTNSSFSWDISRTLITTTFEPYTS